jgi:hypothetical protein
MTLLPLLGPGCEGGFGHLQGHLLDNDWMHLFMLGCTHNDCVKRVSLSEQTLIAKFMRGNGDRCGGHLISPRDQCVSFPNYMHSPCQPYSQSSKEVIKDWVAALLNDIGRHSYALTTGLINAPLHAEVSIFTPISAP